MITMGIRQTVGLFVHPLIGATGMSITEMSMALAIGQLMWGCFSHYLELGPTRGGRFLCC